MKEKRQIESATIKYETEGHIAYITLNRPEKTNALNRAMLEDLRKAFLKADDDMEVRVIVLKGAGPGFCAGHDYGQEEWKEGGGEAAYSTEEHRVYFNRRMRTYLLIWEIPKPFIAQVQGACIAAGTILAGLCDYVVVAEDAKIGPVQAPSPIAPGFYWSMWASLIGMRKTQDFMYLGGTMDGKKAEQIGWANRAVPLQDLEMTVNEIAKEIARTPLEMLMLRKSMLNRARDIMGFRETMLLSSELGIAAHYSDTRKTFWRLMAEKGFKKVMAEWKEGKLKI